MSRKPRSTRGQQADARTTGTLQKHAVISELKPLASVEEINDQEAADVVLTEASQIVADMTSLPLLAQASKGN